jgi:ferredoxin
VSEQLGAGEAAVLSRADFPRLLDGLRARGYRPIGPTLREGAIVYDELGSVDDLPAGWTDRQSGGAYRLERRADAALFGYAVGPHSWKKLFLPPTERLLTIRRAGKGVAVEPHAPEAPRWALVGARACELAAIAVQDRVFLEGPFADRRYEARRKDVFIVAVNCGEAGGTCFCASMQTGPRAESGFDLALTEILAPAHEFVIEAATERGRELLRALPGRAARADDLAAAARVVARTAASMGRSLDTADLKDLLYRNFEHPRWDDVAARCLTCANCTMVCPTCFCTSVEDVTDLALETQERVRRWDSCFTLDFSYLHGGSVRASARARYRQWMTHKLATWIDQFGTSGCVGCGRCITWCPVGIDITEEARAIRASDGAVRPAGEGA